MESIPKISRDAATAGAQIHSSMSSAAQARRNSEPNAPVSLPANSVPGLRQSAQDLDDKSVAAAAGPEESVNDVPDANSANAVMTSLRAGMSAQPGASMLAQANLSPQSVYDLLQ